MRSLQRLLPRLKLDSKIVAAFGLVLALWWGAPSPAATPSRTFDHLTTGFELTGRHRDVPCEACHVNATFKGTPRECVSCQRRGSLVGAAAKPPDHVMSTDRCSECHITAAFLPATRFDHEEVRGSCQSCHNNVRAAGKPANHIVTSMD